MRWLLYMTMSPFGQSKDLRSLMTLCQKIILQALKSMRISYNVWFIERTEWRSCIQFRSQRIIWFNQQFVRVYFGEVLKQIIILLRILLFPFQEFL
jgi:hypothetical protein